MKSKYSVVAAVVSAKQVLHLLSTQKSRLCTGFFFTADVRYFSSLYLRERHDFCKVRPGLTLTMPTGSKLIMLARTTVHFSTVSERFSPHDATFNANTAADLSEAALSAICSLHTATSMYSSSSSLRRQNLSEIAEDAEEVTSSDPAVSSILARLRADKSPKIENGSEVPQELTDNKSSEVTSQVDTSTMDAQYTAQGSKKRKDLPSLHSAATWTVWNEDLPLQTSRALGSRRTSSEDRPRTSNHFVSPHEANEERLRSSYSSRPSTSELFKYGLWKPKVKLFARPVAEAKVKGPKITGAVRQRLPSGMRPRKNEINRPRSAKSTRSTVASDSSRPGTMQSAISIPPPLPGIPAAKGATPVPPRTLPLSQPTPVERLRAVASIENTMYLSGPAPGSSTGKQHSISPEKQKLMKALKLRKEQLEGSSESAAADAGVTRSNHNNFMEPQGSAWKANAGITFDFNVDAKTNGSVFEQEHLHGRADAAPDFESTISFKGAEHYNRTDMPFVNGEVPHTFAITTLPTTETMRFSQLHGQDIATTNVTGQIDGQYNIDHRRTKLSNTMNGQRGVNTHEKCHGLVEPFPVELNLDETDEGSLSDDSLMEELKLAKLQEAKPVPISHSPVRASFSSATSDPRPGFNSVTSVMILNTARSGQERRSAQPVVQYPALLPSSGEMTRKERMSLSRKTNVSSGISRRLQALAEITSRVTSPTPTNNYAPVPDASSSYLAIRKSSLQTFPGPQSVLRPSFAGSRPTSPTDSQYFPVTQPRASNFHAIDAVSTVGNVPQQGGRHDSVSVTARIMRNTTSMPPEQSHLSEAVPMDLQQSTLVIERQPAVHSQTMLRTNNVRTEQAQSILSSRRGSRESSVTTTTKHSAESSWRSMTRWRSEKSEARSPPPPVADRSLSINSLERVDQTLDERKQSRTSRLLKRISGVSATARKPLSEVNAEYQRDQHVGRGHTDSQRESPPAAIVIGDLNVQFPDTLVSATVYADT